MTFAEILPPSIAAQVIVLAVGSMIVWGIAKAFLCLVEGLE